MRWYIISSYYGPYNLDLTIPLYTFVSVFLVSLNMYISMYVSFFVFP